MQLTRAATVVVMTVMVAGCGMLQPTPARFRPPLPDPEPMPGVAVEDVVAQLEQFGYACAFSPESDIPAAWNCLVGDQAAGDWGQVSLSAQVIGPVERVFSYRQIQVGPDTGPDQGVLDRDAASGFDPLIAMIVPEEHRPTADQLLTGVERNYPMELGGGWFIGFDRSQVSRTLHIVFAGGDE